MSVTLRIGFRLLRTRDVRRRTSLCLAVVGVALAALSVLVAFTSLTVVGHRKDVGLARSAIWTEEHATPHVWSAAETYDYDRRQVFRTDIATDGSKAADAVSKPPGLTRWPSPGELVVSPQFAQEVKNSGTLADYAPGEIVGIVGDDGLRAPDELVVYRGAPETEVRDAGVPTAGFGGISPNNRELDESQVRGLAFILLTCLGLPVCAFLVVAARLSAATRLRNLAALRLMGVTTRQATRINAVEQLAVGLAGGLLAVAVHPAVNRALADSGVLAMRWFPETTALGGAGAVVLLLACAGLSWVVGSRTASEAIRSPWRQRRSAPSGGPGPWRLLPLGVGVTGLWFLFWHGFFTGAREDGTHISSNSWMISAVLLTGVGLLIASGSLTERVGRWWGRSGSLNRRIGASRAAFDARDSGKLAAGVLVLVFAIGIGIGHSRDARATTEPEAGAPAIFSALAEQISAEQARRLMKIDRSQARGLAAADVRGEAGVLFTDCESLDRFAGRQVASCTLDSGGGYRLGRGVKGLSLAGRDGGAVKVPLPTERLAKTGLLANYDAVLPLDLKQAYRTFSAVYLVADATSKDEVMSEFVTIAPYSQPSVINENPAQAEVNAALGAYIRLAFVLGALVGLMSLVVALVDRSVQRRRVNARMLAQGMRPGQLRAVQAWEAAASMVPQVALAWVLGIVGAMTWQYTGGLIREPDWEAFGWLTVGTLAALGMAVAVAALSTPRRIEPQLLRAE